jgi:nucleoside-diphosphate-sugar epimerase
MNVLITGGFGFIGSNMAKRHVENGDHVKILARNKNKDYNVRKFRDRIETTIKDIREITAADLINIDLVYHCASTVDNYNVLSDPYLDAGVNILGTITLLEAMKKFRDRCALVYTSTFFVNGNPESLPASMESKENPLGTYGASKLAAEHYIKAYSRIFGVNAKIARLSNVFGIGEQSENNKKAAFNRMVWLAANDKTVHLYNDGKVMRDYIYIDDVVSALEIIALKGESCLNKIYYVGNGVPISLKNMVVMTLSATNPFGGYKNVEPPVFHDNVGMGNFYCDIADTKALGWEPKVSVREGIKRLAEYYITERINDK